MSENMNPDERLEELEGKYDGHNRAIEDVRASQDSLAGKGAVWVTAIVALVALVCGIGSLVWNNASDNRIGGLETQVSSFAKKLDETSAAGLKTSSQLADTVKEMTGIAQSLNTLKSEVSTLRTGVDSRFKKVEKRAKGLEDLRKQVLETDTGLSALRAEVRQAAKQKLGTQVASADRDGFRFEWERRPGGGFRGRLSRTKRE